MLPVLIFVLIAIPVLVIAYRASRRSRAAGEHPNLETDADRAEIENEFAQAEAYQEEWREEEKKHPRDTII